MQKLEPDEYYALKLWCWDQVKSDGGQTYYKAKTITENPFLGASVSDECVSESELCSLIILGERIGNIEKTLFAYEAFQYNYNTMKNTFYPFRDRMIPYRRSTAYNDYMTANAMYQNVITSGKRLIESQEASIKHCFGKESDQYNDWHEFTALLYDSFQSYRFFNQIRNSIEHCYTTFELVNINEELGTMGFAVNLEHESLERLFAKSKIRKEFEDFANAETHLGKHPWLSVTKIFEEFKMLMVLLRKRFLSVVLNSISRKMIDEIPNDYNAIVKLSPKDPTKRNFHRLYPIPQRIDIMRIVNYEQSMLGVAERVLLQNAILMNGLISEDKHKQENDCL